VQPDRLGQPSRLPVGGGEIAPRVQRVGVIRAEDPLPVGQGPLQQRDRLGGPARGLVGGGQVIPRGHGARVIRAQHPLEGGQGLLVQRDRLGGSPRLPVGGGQVVSRGQGVGVVRAEDPLGGGQGQLVQPDGLGRPPDIAVGGGQVAPRGQGVGVVRAEDPLPVGQGPLQQPDRFGRLPDIQVSGGQVVPRGQRPGVVRPQHPLGVPDQGLADRDRLPGAVTEFVEVIQRRQPQSQQGLFQLAGGIGRGLPQRCHLLGEVPHRRAVPRSAQGARVRLQHRGGGQAHRGQAALLGEAVADHAQDQPVGDDGLARQAEGQQRPLGQPLQRLIDRRRAERAGRQRARLPGAVQQVPADPGR